MTDHHDSTQRRCFCCGAATDLSAAQAVRDGWSFSTVRDIASCPAHSIHTHDVNAARAAASFGFTVEHFYRSALPIAAPPAAT